jgi:dTMP kinase
MRGRFVTFEGLEGSGKSTLIERLATHLRASGHDVLTTREPGGTPLGRELRALLLQGRAGEPREPAAEALMMIADRAEHVARVVRPALDAGRIVLCDRYGDSTIAYQGGGSGLDRAMLARMNAWATGGLVPDLTVLLDLPADATNDRLVARAAAPQADRFEREPLDYHARVRAAYLELAAAEPARWAVLDAVRGADAVFDDVRARVDAALAGLAARAAGGGRADV